MQNTLNFPLKRSPELEVSPAFNIVIAYEDFETGKRAMRTYDYLVQHLGEECGFRNQMWKFDVLSVAKLREMAVKDATAADIIIVAAHGADALPAAVKEWMEAVLAEQTNAIALVGLFDSEASIGNSPREYLVNAAKRGGMEFFSQPGLWPGKNPELRGEDEDGWERNKAFSVLASVVQENNTTVSHWGINE